VRKKTTHWVQGKKGESAKNNTKLRLMHSPDGERVQTRWAKRKKKGGESDLKEVPGKRGNKIIVKPATLRGFPFKKKKIKGGRERGVLVGHENKETERKRGSKSSISGPKKSKKYFRKKKRRGGGSQCTTNWRCAQLSKKGPR